MDDTEKIGCCGAYCRTCREFLKTCKGCKLGYLDGSRELRRAKCGMKVCCLTKGHITCADCERFDSCETLQGFLLHPGYKYSKCGQALAFIRANGYSAFLEVADRWKNAYGKFEYGVCRPLRGIDENAMHTGCLGAMALGTPDRPSLLLRKKMA